MNPRALTRRHLLRAAGTVIVLPALESIGFRRFASAAPAVARPKRMVFLGFGWGVTAESWYPDAKVTSADYKLPPGLAPLARHQKDFTLVQGLTNKFSNEAHWGSTFWLTGGANLKLGQHLVVAGNTPLCNAWLTLLHVLGIEAERHGYSSGVVKELQG